jgi:hypothetical protein
MVLNCSYNISKSTILKYNLSFLSSGYDAFCNLVYEAMQTIESKMTC